jgi:MoaA/NifB/PqqE/SkfB family radical SAM enzyme
MADNIELTKYKQDILIGSARLSKGKKITYDRGAYMVENMFFNKAYKFSIGANHNFDQNKLLHKFKKKYKDYRKRWNGQPEKCINEKNFGPRLLESGNVPLCIDIETAAICDLACPFCYRDSLATPDKVINMRLFKKIVDQASDLGIPSLKLNYRGEPLMNPKLYKMIEYAKQKGIIEVIINTNATHLSEKTSRRLIDAGLDFMIYSFDGGTKETYEKMRPGRFKKNAFEDVYENIVRFSKIRGKMNAKFPRTKIQMILTKSSYNEQELFFDLFSNCVDEVTVTQYSERGGDIEDLSAAERDRYKILCDKLGLPDSAPYLKDAKGDISVSDSRLPCKQPYQRMMVTYDGRVAMCCSDWGAMHPIGYISSDSFEDEDADKKLVLSKINDKKKGFELMQNVKFPPKFNKPNKIIQTLSEIWIGSEVEKVRRFHEEGNMNQIAICKGCTFKDTYNWIKP